MALPFSEFTVHAIATQFLPIQVLMKSLNIFQTDFSLLMFIV